MQDIFKLTASKITAIITIMFIIYCWLFLFSSVSLDVDVDVETKSSFHILTEDLKLAVLVAS